MISRQEYERRRNMLHKFDPDSIPHDGGVICKYCALLEDAKCHGFEEEGLSTTDEENSQMENGLGGIPTIDICREYLLTGRTTLWGQAWDIKDAGRREEAARWLAREVDRINGIRNMAMASSSPLGLIIERARRMEV